MENTQLNLDLVTNLSRDSKIRIEQQNTQLIKTLGAGITITKVKGNTIQVKVKNLNGLRSPKHELLVKSHRILSENIPQNYRLQIIL